MSEILTEPAPAAGGPADAAVVTYINTATSGLTPEANLTAENLEQLKQQLSGSPAVVYAAMQCLFTACQVAMGGGLRVEAPTRLHDMIQVCLLGCRVVTTIVMLVTDH